MRPSSGSSGDGPQALLVGAAGAAGSEHGRATPDERPSAESPFQLCGRKPPPGHGQGRATSLSGPGVTPAQPPACSSVHRPVARVPRGIM